MIKYWKPEENVHWKPYPATKIPPKKAKYTTILSLSQEWQENTKITYSGPLYVDLDGKLEDALKDLKTAIRILEVNYEVPLESLYVYFTGGRGFHLLIPPQLIENPKEPLLPYIYKRMVFEMFDLPTIDMSVYSGKRGRMWRVPNRQRTNGNYKIPVSIQEIFDHSAQWFVEKSKKWRTNFQYPELNEFGIVTPLQKLFQKCKSIVEKEQKNFLPDPVTVEQIQSLHNHIPCMIQLSQIQKLHKPEIFNRYAMVVAGYLASGKDFEFFNDFINYNFNDSEHYPNPKLRQEHIKSLIKYFQGSSYAFGCKYVRGLKPLKFECAECELYTHKPIPKPSKYTLDDIKALFCEYMMLDTESLEMIDVALASCISIFLPDDPVWLLIVAPPSSAKSELINALTEIPHTFSISEYTPKTMASGKPGETALLQKLKNKTTILFKDFTTVLEMRSEDKAAIFAQLRELYDGYYKKAFGSGKIIEWKGKLGIVAAVTEIIDAHFKTIKILGERFIQYRLEEPDPIDVAKVAFDSSGIEKEKRGTIKKMIVEYFLSINLNTKIDFPPNYRNEIADLAIFTVKTRTGIIRDWRDSIVFIPNSEGPARMTKQLKCMAKSLALVQKKTEVDSDIMRIIRKIAFDSITSLKKSIVQTLCENGIVELSTAELAEKVHHPPTPVKRAAQDLVGQQVLFVDLQSNEEDAKKSYYWQLGKWGNYFKKHLFVTTKTKEIPF